MNAFPLLCSLLLLAACKNSSPDPTQKAAPSAVRSVGAALPSASPTPNAPAAATSPGADERARAVLDRWLRAQNDHDFEAYSKLYAQRFSGVKRVGKHTAWFNRKTWLDDRRAMVQGKARVEVDDVSVRSLGKTARVLFTQTFTAGTFRDTGRKELILIDDDGELRISREEMLLSNVAGKASTQALGESFGARDRLIFFAGGETLPIAGAPRLVQHDKVADFAIERELALDQLDPRHRARIGQSFEVVLNDGTVCKAKVARLFDYAEAVPHFGLLRDWRGEEGSPALSDAQIAQQVSDLVPAERHYLVGELEKTCRGALMAFPDGSLPPVVAARAPSPALGAAAESEFERVPEFAALEQEYRRTGQGAAKRWDRLPGEIVQKAFSVAPGRELVVRSVATSEMDTQGCAGFFGSLAVSFSFDTTGPTPKLLEKHVLDRTEVKPAVALDIDRDGAFEIVSAPVGFDGAQYLYGKRGAELLYSYFYNDCPC